MGTGEPDEMQDSLEAARQVEAYLGASDGRDKFARQVATLSPLRRPQRATAERYIQADQRLTGLLLDAAAVARVAQPVALEDPRPRPELSAAVDEIDTALAWLVRPRFDSDTRKHVEAATERLHGHLANAGRDSDGDTVLREELRILAAKLDNSTKELTANGSASPGSPTSRKRSSVGLDRRLRPFEYLRDRHCRPEVSSRAELIRSMIQAMLSSRMRQNPVNRAVVVMSAAGTLAAGWGLLFSDRFAGQSPVRGFGIFGLVVTGWCVWQLRVDRPHPVAVMVVIAVGLGALGSVTDHGFRLSISAILVLYAAVGAVVIADTRGFWLFVVFVGAAGGFPFVAERFGWVSLSEGEVIGDLVIEGIVFWAAAWIFRRVRDEIITREQYHRSKDAFLAGVGHELRTPLTSVLGYADLIAEETSASSQVQEMAKVMGDEARSMAAVIEDFTLVARAEDDILSLKPSVVSTTQVIFRALSLIPRSNRNLTVTDPSDATVYADPDRLCQMLRVLIANGLQYAASEVEVVVRTEGHLTVVEVIDDGPGFKPNEVESLFDVYHHSEADRGQPERLGLGLFVARRLADAMDVDLGWERRHDTTIFRVRLPEATRSETVPTGS